MTRAETALMLELCRIVGELDPGQYGSIISRLDDLAIETHSKNALYDFLAERRINDV